MSGLNIQNSRLQQKYSTITGATPTIAPSTDHTDGTWTENDLYVGELYINVQDDTMFYRSLNGIIPITSGTTTINTTTFVNKTGDTMTGPLFTTTLSANTISATTVYSPSFNGTFIGDGSQLTGITSTTFTGGTVSGPVIFTSDVNLCGAAVTVSELSGCGGTIDVYSVINALDAISATTFYGDGSGLTNLPYFSGLTLDEVLTLGDTSISGNIVLSGGNITLGSGVFYGDGSGLTNIPPSTIPTLDDVLTTGNVSDNNDILLTNGDIVLGSGIFYGDGSGLTNIPATNDVFVTGGTYDNTSGTATFTNNTGDTFTVTGFTTASAGDYLPLSGGTMDNNAIIQFDNASQLKEGNYDFGGQGGISQICSVGYENNWQSGINHIFDNNGFIRESSHCFTTIPDNTFDSSLRFKVDSRWVLDNGDTYVCSDASVGAAVWTLLYNDIYVSGGTYTAGTATFTNTSGGTFNVSGFTSPQTLEDTLILGNISGNNDILMSKGTGVYAEDNDTTGLDLDGGYAKLVVTNGVTEEGYIDIQGNGNTSMFGTAALEIDFNNISINSSNSGFTGIEYFIDYSADYTNRSLVDKEYVDNSISDSTIWTAGTGVNSAVLGGSGSIASGDYAVAEGEDTIASGNISHAEGTNTTASGDYSHSEGYYTTASGQTSHAEGEQTIAGGYTSHAEGIFTTASGDHSHAEGFTTTASGENSHAEGSNTIASGYTSHAEGSNTIASGYISHAEGVFTTASGQNSHAEGEYTVASGYDSHAQGSYTTASGIGSHSSGSGSTAIGDWSFVHGTGSTASADGSIVLGSDLSGVSTNTVYVNKLNINSLPAGTSINNLGIDSSGNVIIGSPFSGYTLSEVLINGNTTNGNNIIISSGDTINSYDDIFKIDITNGRFIYEDANVTSKLDIGVDEINLEVYDTSINKRARIQTGLDGLGDVYAELSANDMSLGIYTGLLIKTSGATFDSLYSGFKGIEYASDYSINFVNRSLVDKEYVDNSISGFSTGYTYITEDTVAETLVFSGANSIETTVTGEFNTHTLRVDGDQIRLTALGGDGETNYLLVNKDIIANYASLEAVSNNYAYETLSPTQKNINIYDDTNAQSTYTLTQTSEISRIEDGAGSQSESNINASTAYLLNTAGEGVNTSVSVDQNYAEMKQQEGDSVTRLQVSNDGFYQSQYGSTGILKGVSKTNFTSLETIDDTPTSVVWPLSGLEIGTTAVGIKATVTGINLADDKAYISELYAAVRMNAYAVVIFGGVDKLEKTEFTTATSTIDIESSNAAIIVTGEVGETIRWSVKYELIYAV